jgi:hypothetical protein
LDDVVELRRPPTRRSEIGASPLSGHRQRRVESWQGERLYLAPLMI